MIYRGLSMLPLGLLYRLSIILYYCIYRLAGYRKTVVRENLQRCFCEQSENEITILMDKFYRQLCDLAAEMIHTAKMSPDELGDRVQLRNRDELLDWCGNGPAIVVSLHKNNWEWLLASLGALTPLQLDPIYKPAHQSSLDRFLHSARSRYGVRPIATGTLATQLLQRRRQNRGYCLLADQAPVEAEATRTLAFMGRETHFQAGMEKLARLTGYPVIFADMQRLQRGYYELGFELLLEAGQDPVEQALLNRYAQACERAIRRQPESWLWSHNRWKNQTAGNPGALEIPGRWKS